MFLLSPWPTLAAPVKAGIIAYGVITKPQISWMKSKFDMIVNPSITDPATFNGFSGSLWATYLDITTIATLTQYMDMADYAAQHGINSEEMLLHAKVNFTASISTAWSSIDKFDAFEGVNGVLLKTGETFTDKTAVAYSGASPYTTINQNLYIGYEFPFDQATFNVRTAATSLVGIWQYWNGSAWATLSVTDGTAAMTTTGTLSFTPPSNWARTRVNGSRNKYFIRFAYTSAVSAPVINTIKGDAWVRGAANLCRGWDSTNGKIVNSGELAYNPTPPVGASAKFRYQARVPTWGVNHFVFNIADFQMMEGTATRTVAAYIAQSTINGINAIPFTGIMYDDGIFPATFGSLGIANTDFVDKTSNTAAVEGLNRYQDIYAIVKAAKPTLMIGINAYNKSYARLGDWNIYEYFNYTYGVGDATSTNLTTTDSPNNMGYDAYLDINNPGKPVKGMMVYEDSRAMVYNHVWDQANRGPILSLAKHLIGMNDNTTFAYFTNGAAIYSERDDFSYYDSNTTTLSAPITADTSSNSKTLSGVDFSQFTSTRECLAIGSGSTLDMIRSGSAYSKANNTTLTTSGKIYFNHSIGEPVKYCRKGYFTTDTVPPMSRMVRWGNWFPAMAVNFGTGGARNMQWAKGTNYGWPNLLAFGQAINTNIWSRDFTNALVLVRPNGGASSAVNYSEYTGPIPLGGTYYPLMADGNTGPAITSISLRRAEGAILMKAPVSVVPTPPAATSPTKNTTLQN